jgi:hypothetical protein
MAVPEMQEQDRIYEAFGYVPPPHPYRVPEAEPRRSKRLLRKIAPPAAIGLLAIAAGALWVWDHGSEARAVAGLPTRERRVLYQRTLDNLKFCRSHRDEVRAFCDQQARLATAFPECDAECDALVRLHLHATR